MKLEAVNDFVVKFANVNGSGSASANTLFAKSILRMGVPVSPRNIFPSNIQGLPTWYEGRVSDAILALDDSMPTGTYVDMCSKLPLLDPTKIQAATIVMRGEWDGIASFEDLIEFYKKLPNTDKQFAMMKGISHASFQQKNYYT